MTRSLRRSLIELITQWKGDGLDAVAFCYRPLERQQQIQCLHSLDEHSVFVIDADDVVVPFGMVEHHNRQPWCETVAVEYNRQRHQREHHYSSKIPQQQQRRHQPSSRFREPVDMHRISAKPSDEESHLSGSLLKFPSLQCWSPISIFPGSRSTIGSAPVIQVCSLPSSRRFSLLQSPSISHPSVDGSDETLTSYLPRVSSDWSFGKQPSVKHSLVETSPVLPIKEPSTFHFVDYNNLIRSVSPLLEFVPLYSCNRGFESPQFDQLQQSPVSSDVVKSRKYILMSRPSRLPVLLSLKFPVLL